MAYQIAFDMYESATQQFLSRVLGKYGTVPVRVFKVFRPGFANLYLGLCWWVYYIIFSMDAPDTGFAGYPANLNIKSNMFIYTNS
jgi:hypothetical protein